MRAAITALLVVGCAPAERFLVLPTEDPTAKVALVALDADLAVTDVGGPIALDDVPSFPLSDRADVLVAFAIQASDYVDLDAQPIAIDGVRVVRASDPPSSCGSCLVPRDTAPAIIGPGDRCPPPPFAPRTGLRGERGSIDDATFEIARQALRIEWPGTCGDAWSPYAASRAPISAGCGWLPFEDPVEVSHVAQADDGTVLTMSRVGGIWARTTPDGRRTRGQVDLGLKKVMGLVGLPELPGRWVVATESAIGETRVTMHVLAEQGDVLAIESTQVIEELTVERLSAGRHARGQFEALGYGRLEVSVLPIDVMCRYQSRTITCVHPTDVERRCTASRFDASTMVGRRSVASTPEGHMMIANADGTARWKCLSPPSRLVPTRSSTVTFAVRELGASISLGNRYFGCVGNGEGGYGLLTFTMNDAPPGDATFEADVAATRLEVMRLRGDSCRGFVSTSSSAAVALIGTFEFNVHADGRIIRRNMPQLPEVTRADILVPGWTVAQDADDRVFRARSGAPRELVVGGAEPVAHIAAIAPVSDGFVILQNDAQPLFLAVDPEDVASCRRRAPSPFPIAGLDAVLTATTAPLEAWTAHDGAWWSWQRRDGGRSALVRIDLGAGRATVFPADFAASDLLSMAFLDDDDAIVTTDLGVHRVHIEDDRATVTPLAIDPPARFVASDASDGVAWLSGETGAITHVLARVTRASAEGWVTTSLPREPGDAQGNQRGRHAGLVVLAPNHVLMSTFDVSTLLPFEVSRLVTRDFGPIGRACDLGHIGHSLSACIFEESSSIESLTPAAYGAHLGIGPGDDPLLINAFGLIYGPTGLRGSVGFNRPFALAGDDRGMFAVAGAHGLVFVGLREAISTRRRAVVAIP